MGTLQHRQDRSEQHDLSSEQPERAEKLAEMWQAYAERANVLPLNPGSKRKQTTHSTKNRNDLS